MGGRGRGAPEHFGKVHELYEYHSQTSVYVGYIVIKCIFRRSFSSIFSNNLYKCTACSKFTDNSL